MLWNFDIISSSKISFGDRKKDKSNPCEIFVLSHRFASAHNQT